MCRTQTKEYFFPSAIKSTTFIGFSSLIIRNILLVFLQNFSVKCISSSKNLSIKLKPKQATSLIAFPGVKCIYSPTKPQHGMMLDSNYAIFFYTLPLYNIATLHHGERFAALTSNSLK
jgi:hypothetical protein